MHVSVVSCKNIAKNPNPKDIFRGKLLLVPTTPNRINTRVILCRL